MQTLAARPRRPKNRSLVRVAAGAALLGVCAALCRAVFAQPDAAVKPSAPGDAATPTAAADEAARRAQVVARFDSGAITVGDVEDAIAARVPFAQERYRSLEAVRSVLDGALRFELLAAEAKRRGYGEREAVVSAAKQSAVQALIRERFDEKITPESIAADDVRKYYDAHVNEFVRPEMRRASVLLVGSSAELKKLMPQVRAADLRAFRELVRTHSVDPTNRLRGGDVRYFDATGHLRGETGPDVDAGLARAVFSLAKVGDITEPVRIGDRFAVAKLTGVRPAAAETIEQTQERIRMRLWRQRRQAAIDAHIQALKRAQKPEVHPELIDAVRLDVAPPSRRLERFPQTAPGPRPEPVPAAAQ